MLKKMLKKIITNEQKWKLKSKYNRAKKYYANTFYSYNGGMLVNKLKEMGVKETDTLLVHSGYKQDSGFQGTPRDVVTALVEYLGINGNLIMVSLPFTSYAYDYLKENKPFNIKKTMSKMGIITESFRRKKGVSRSFHPTHPVLVYGKDAEWIVADHEKCLYPCGNGSPFEKIKKLNGKILFYDVDMDTITFMHYVEETNKNKLPFQLFHSELLEVKGYDNNNKEHILKTYVYNPKIKRNLNILVQELIKNKVVKTGNVGNSGLSIVTAEDVVTCQTNMYENGIYFYEW